MMLNSQPMDPFAFLPQGQPALVSPDHADVVTASLQSVSRHPLMVRLQTEGGASASTGDDFWLDEDDWRAVLQPYTVVDGVLQIPVRGVLLHDFPYQFFSWATGYKYIEKAFKRGMEDENVRGIALVIDSPGGMVAGCFDAVDRMIAAKGDKPVRAFAAETATSAAYAIATVADSITVSRTGAVGSVGVVTSHFDVSKMMGNAGLKITFIHAGKHKVDGNSYEPLPADVKDRIQSRVDGLYSIFVASVAENRGMDEEAVRATEALVYSAAEAQSVGFADSIGALDEELADWSASLKPDTGDTHMSKTTQVAEEATTEAATNAARAEGHAAGVTEGHAAGVAAERERISAIMNCDEAATRSGAALTMALTTDLSADQAKGLLAQLPEDAAPEAAKTTEPGAFVEAMNTSKNPEISPEGGEGGPSAEVPTHKRILADAGLISLR